jgi:hypothetical protein
LEWVNDHYPDQPGWLQNLKKGAQELPDQDKKITNDDTKPEDKDTTE